MSSTAKARVLGKRREKKRRRLILSGSDEDDDNMVSTNANKSLDEGGNGVKVETKSDLGVEAVTQVEAVEVHQNGIEDDSKKIETGPLAEEKSGIDGSIRVEEVKVESNTGSTLEAVDRMEVDDHRAIENATPKKEIHAEDEIVLRSKDVKKHRENGTLEESCKQIEIALPTRDKGVIDGSTRVEEVKVESNTGLSLEAVDRMEVDDGKKIENATPKKEIHAEYELVSSSKVDDGKKIENATPKKEIHAEYELVSRSKDVKKHKATDVLGDSRHGSGSMIKTKNGPDCSPRKEATEIGLKKVLKSKVDNRREEVGSTKFYTAKRNNSIDKLSGKEGMELYMKKVLESKHVKVGEEAGGNNKSPGFSVSSRKMKDQVLLEEEKVELKKVPRSAVVKGRGEAESGKKRATESGSERKRQREISGDEIHSKKFRLDSHRQELSSERGEKNTKRRFLKSGDEGYNDRQRGESDEKTMQENLKKNELLSEKKRATELGSERKRQRDTSGDEIHSKKFRPEHVKHRQELSSERSEKNTKRRFLKSGDEGYNNKQRGEFDEKTMQEDLKKNELPSENGRWMERSTARTLRKLKDNGTPGSVRNDDADVSQQNGPRVQGKQVALRVNNKKVREVEGVHVQREEKESKKLTRNHLALSKERKFEKPISTIKKPSKVSAPGAKTARGASSPKINSRKAASSNVTTDPIAEGGTGSASKASVLIQLNTEVDGHKGGKGRGKGGNKQQSTAKQKIREEIKGILLDAGWWIDLRPRRGRAYEDSVYMPPTGGGGFWSITKAYAKYMEYSKNSNASSEKQSKKATGGDRDHEGATPTFATVPADHLNMLTRKVVNKRRSREEIERDELLGVRKGRTIRRDASESGKGRNKRRGLLVRGANPDANADDDDYVPYIWKRTIMSWMIDSGVVQLDGKVKYMNKKQTRALLVGSITRDGIRCSCCSKIISISKFEIHAGSKLHQPYQNIIVDESGDSLLQCQVNAWEKQQESERQSFYKVDTEGDDPNDDSCGICGDGGDLICCDGCPSTFHLNCLDFQMLPPGEWHCTNCSCRYCGLVVDDVPIENDSDTSTLLTCLQCEKKFHVDCIPEAEVISVSSNDSDVSFCGKNCKKVFKKLQKLIGTKNSMEAGLSWRLIRHFGDESSGHPLSLPKKVECNSKIAVAFAVMDECFCPIVDYRSGINLIHNVVYNCGSNINRLSFTGFYAFVLERGDEIIAVASVRIHGTRLAEMPFIGTRNMYRRQGMCRQLLNGIESALYSLNVEKLIIPAISELTETWTNIFGFKHLNLSQRQEVRSTNMLVFPGTGLLQKPILSKGSTEEHSTYGGGEVGESVREEKRIATNETTVHQNQEPDNAVATVALGSNATGDNSGGCAAVIENQHLLGASNESSVSSVNPELYGADKGVSDPKFEPAVVCHNEPMVEDAYQTSSWNVSKIEAPWEVTMFDNHETKDRGVTDTPSLYVVNGTSVRHATEDGHGPQEPTGAKITHNMHSDGDILLPKSCVVCCNSSGINGFTMQDCDGCHAHAPVFPQDCSSVATHLPSFEPTGESGSSSVVCHGSLAANEHVVDANHVRGTHSTTFQAELKPSSDSLSHSDLGVDAKLVDSMEVDQETEPCTDSVNDRPSGIPRAKESEANGSSVTNNSCNITEPDKGMPCDGCSHRQHMVARDSAPVIVSNTASCEFTGCTLLDSSHLKSESGPDPHARGSVAEFPNSHAAEDFSCGVGPSICMGTASGGSLSKVVAQELEKNSDDVSAKTDHCRAKGVCDTAHSDDVSVDAIPAHSGTLQDHAGSDGALNL